MNKEQIITTWINTAVGEGGIDRYDDLHIDQIDDSWASPDSWENAGIEALSLAVSVRDRLQLNIAVAVAWSLRTDGIRHTIGFEQKHYLGSEMNGSPPSLYLFRYGAEPWTQINLRTKNVQKAIVESVDSENVRYASVRYWCFLEFYQGNELSRSVFALG